MEKLRHTKSQKDLSSASDEFEEDDDQLNSDTSLYTASDTNESIEEDDTNLGEDIGDTDNEEASYWIEHTDPEEFTISEAPFTSHYGLKNGFW